MPYQTHIDEERQRSYVLLSGHVTGRELSDALQTVLADPRWHPSLGGLWDARHITILDVRPEEVAEVVAAAAERRPLGPGRTAFVADRRVVIDAALLFRRLLRPLGRDIEVFSTLEAAEAWLRPAVPGRF